MDPGFGTPGRFGGAADARNGVVAERPQTGHPRRGAVGEFAGDFEHLRSECRNEDGDRRPSSDVEGSMHVVDLSLEGHWFSLEQRHERREVLPHLESRARIGQTEHALDHRPVRETHAEREAAS
jgi:hypothetical protein